MGTSGTNTFEGGSDGVLITGGPGNSGGASGTPFDAIWGTAFTYAAAAAYQGSLGASVAASQYGAGQWSVSSAKVSLKMWFKVGALPTADCFLFRVQNSGGTRLFSVHANAAGKLRVDDAAGTTGVFTFANALTPGTWYRLEAYVVAGSTSSNGTIKVAYYAGNSTTPVESQYFANGTANVGAGQTFTTIILGKYNNAPEAYSFDAMSYDTTLSDFIGMPTAAPPTVSTPPVQNVSAGASVSMSVTASSSTGTITSYAWSVIYSSTGSNPTLTGASTSTVGFTATSDTTKGHLYILQCVVTDSNSLTTTVTSEVRVPTAGDAAPLPGSPAAVVGTWANVGGAATPGDAVGDSSQATYVETPTLTTTAVTDRFRVAPMTARGSLTFQGGGLQQDVSGAVTAKVRLFQGTTQLQEVSLPAVGLAPAWSTNTVTLSTTGVSDWGNLYIELVGTAP